MKINVCIRAVRGYVSVLRESELAERILFGSLLRLYWGEVNSKDLCPREFIGNIDCPMKVRKRNE